jgi:general secretion pathway protein N
VTKNLKIGIALATLVGAFFVVRLPAILAAHALPNTVSLAGVEGSLWNGSASALGIKGVVSQEKLSWHFEPSALLHGKLAWQIHGEFQGSQNNLRILLGFHPSLEQVKLSLPLDPLMRFNSTVEGLRLRGTIFIQSERLALKSAIKASLRLEQVATAISAEPAPLGNYQGNVEMAADGTGTLHISSLGGPLRVSGGGNFSFTGNPTNIKLMLQPNGDIPALAAPLATLPREGSQYVLTFKRP